MRLRHSLAPSEQGKIKRRYKIMKNRMLFSNAHLLRALKDAMAAFSGP